MPKQPHAFELASRMRDALRSENYEAGELSNRAAEFIEKLRRFDKRELGRLSTAQYKFLRDVAKGN